MNSRKVGSGENKSSYHSLGIGSPDYTVLATFESDTDRDLVTEGVSEKLECFAGLHSDSVNMSGGTYDATHIRTICPAAGAGHHGVGLLDGSIVAFNDTTANYTWRISSNFTQIQDIVTKHVVSGAAFRAAYYFPGGSDSAFVGCIAVDCDNTGAGDHYDFQAIGTSNRFFINCIGIGGHVGMRTHGGSDIATAYNCTLDGYSGDVFQVNGTLTSKNVIFNGTNSVTGTHNQTTNLIGNPTAAQFVDSANNDYHLLGKDTAARGQGTDLSADATYAFSDDINQRAMGASKQGQERTGAWDIGADQFVKRVKVA